MAQWISRAWCFTVNAPKGSSKDDAMAFLKPVIETIKSLDHCNLALQIECGDSGTYHIQGVIELKQKTRMKELKALIHPTAHLEKCRDITASIKYCTKEDTAVGDRVLSGKWEADWRDWVDWKAYEKFVSNGPACWGCSDKFPYCHGCIEHRASGWAFEDDKIESPQNREDNIL